MLISKLNACFCPCFPAVLNSYVLSITGFSGFVVESIGYSLFFVSTALIGVPVLVLVAWAAYLEHRRNINGVDDSSD